jgi:hypothetical protein
VLVSPEPISPELVLVDPELAERERACLREKAALEAYFVGHPSPTPVQRFVAVAEHEPRPQPPRLTTRAILRKRVLPAALVASLFANGYFVADVVLRADRQTSTAVAVAVRPAATVAPGTSVTRETHVKRIDTVAVTRKKASPSQLSPRLPRKAVIERKLVSLLLTAPARKLPQAFVDPKTGLVRNNVQVVCRAAKRHSYLCAVGRAKARGGKAIVVRYRVTRAGRGVFSWSGYKPLK